MQSRQGFPQKYQHIQRQMNSLSKLIHLLPLPIYLIAPEPRTTCVRVRVYGQLDTSFSLPSCCQKM